MSRAAAGVELGVWEPGDVLGILILRVSVGEVNLGEAPFEHAW